VWVLILVAVVNGAVVLDAFPTSDRFQCEELGKKAVEAANHNGVNAGFRCKEIKIT
jgi:hypothetical protein